MNRILLISLFSAVANAFFFKRTLYGDGNEGVATPDYVNSYYGFPSVPSQERRHKPSTFNIYPPQGFFRREHPFDFGPFAYTNARAGDANLGEPVEKTERERAMAKAKPGIWRQHEIMNRIKNIFEEQKMNVEQKHTQIRRVLAAEGAEMRSKFADLHKRLIMKNNKMMFSSTISPVPELSKQAKKLEKEAKKIIESKKMSVEKKQEKLDKLMLKAPESVKNELNAINDSSISTPVPAPAPAVDQTQASNRVIPSMPSQMDILNRAEKAQAVIEARQIRVSEDGKTVEF